MFPTVAHISGICFSEKYLTSYSTPKTGICHFILPSFSAGETPKRRAGHAVARIFFTARASISPPHVSGGESSTQARDLVWFTHHLCLKLSLPWFSPATLSNAGTLLNKTPHRSGANLPTQENQGYCFQGRDTC